MKTPLLSILFFSSFVLLPSAFSQGSLAPPAAPAPTMKTLDQIEPRTPISTLPFTISTPGVYYLTKSVSTTGDGITILSDDVILDLMGFTLTGDGGSGDNGVQIGTTTGQGHNRVTIRNGRIVSFGSGVAVFADSTLVLIEDIDASTNSINGITLNGPNSGVQRSTVRRCRVDNNGANGIAIGNIGSAEQDIIEECQLLNNTVGLLVNGTGNLIIRNLASGNVTNDYQIVAGNRLGAIITPIANAATVTTSGGGTGTSDPFANLRY